MPNQQPSTPVWGIQSSSPMRSNSSGIAPTRSSSPGTTPISNYQPSPPTGSSQRPITVRSDSSSPSLTSSYQPRPNRQPSPPGRESTTIKSNNSDTVSGNPDPSHGRTLPIEKVLDGLDSITDWTQWDRDLYVKKVQECLQTLDRVSQDFAEAKNVAAGRIQKLELMRRQYVQLSEDHKKRFERCENDMKKVKGVLNMEPSDPKFRTLQLKLPDCH